VTAKFAAEGDRPYTVTFGRYLLATLALFPVWWWLERKKIRPFARGDWSTMLGMAATGMIAYNLLFLFGVQFAPASDGALLVPGLSGFFGLLLVSIDTRKRPAGRAWAGAALGILGAALVGL